MVMYELNRVQFCYPVLKCHNFLDLTKSLLFILVMHIKTSKYCYALGYGNRQLFSFPLHRAPPFALHFLSFAFRGRQWLKQVLHKHYTDSIPLHNPKPLSESPTPRRPIPVFLRNNSCTVVVFFFLYYLILTQYENC